METEILAYSINGVCAAIQTGRTKVYEMIADGRLEAKKLDGKTVITRQSLVRLIEELPDADIGREPKKLPDADLGKASDTEPSKVPKDESAAEAAP